MHVLGKVRRMKVRDKLTTSEISKRAGLGRNSFHPDATIATEPATSIGVFDMSLSGSKSHT